MTIRVLVAEDQPVVRKGIGMILAAEDDIDVVAEAGDGRLAVQLAREHHVDVVVMDIRMPNMDGIEATRLLTSDGQRTDRLTKVLVLTTFDEDAAVYGALKAGASGYVLKHAAPDALVSAVRAVAAGQSWIDPAVAGPVIAALREGPDVAASSSEVLARLTTREREVLILMAKGLSIAEIAQRWVLSEATVKTHVARVLMKSGSRDRAQAVALAYQTGLVVPPARPSKG